jgi:SAM-dependent methyltransferase
VKVLDDLLVARLTRCMSLPRALIYLALILLTAFVPLDEAFHQPAYLGDDGHAKQSLTLAVNRAMCGQSSTISGDVQLDRLLPSRRDLSRIPLVDVIANQWGSVERYCATMRSPIANNENSLMLTEAWLLRLLPRLSLTGLSRILLGLQVVMLAVFCFALLRSGAGVLMCAGILQIGIAILLKTRIGLEVAEYPFLACLVALLVGMYMLMFRPGSARALASFVVAAGVITAYASNMRTSYLPISLGFFGAWLAGALSDEESLQRRVRGAVAAVLLFAAGYATFHYSFVPRVASPIGSAHHPIAHPLVLSLAIPSNPLAEREGIEWEDAVGERLARRVNPSVSYLAPGYEAALFDYYIQLWRRYPREMFVIYARKWQIAGTRVVAEAAKGEWNWLTAAVLSVLAIVPSGVWFLTIFLTAACVSFATYLRFRAPLLLGGCLLAIAGTFLLAETAIIMPSYALMYHQSLLLVSGVLTLAAAQGLVSLLVYANAIAFQSRQAPDNRDLQSTRERTIADFGEQWTAYTDNSGFYGSPALLDDVFGPLLSADEIKGAVIADIGAGTGRFTNLFVQLGAAKVIAVEPSRAFDVLTRNTVAAAGSVECVRCDAEHFKPPTPVDVMFSFGVLHHIPDPRASVAAMREGLKRGGRIAIWLYGREGNEAFVALLTLVAGITRRLSHEALEACVWIIYVPTCCYMWLCRLLPLPLRRYFVDIFSKLAPDKRRLVLYDQLNPAYAKYYWQQEVRALLEEAGFADVRLYHRHGYSWTALAVKP